MNNSDHEPDILLLEVPLGAAVLRFSFGSYKGRNRIDARIWFFPAGSDQLHASRKGITIPAEHIPAAIRAMQRGLQFVGDAECQR